MTTPENQEAIERICSRLSDTTEALLKTVEAVNRSAESMLRLTEAILNAPDEPDEHASGYLSG